MLTAEAVENPVKKVLGFGQSIWYDGLIPANELRKMIHEDGLMGATTNPAIFEKALTGNEYDGDIRRLAKDLSAEGIYQTLAVRAVR